LEKLFEPFVFGRGQGNGDDVIDMDREYDSAGGGLAAIDAPFTLHLFEAPLSDGAVEGLIPYMTGLFHPIDALHQAHDPLRLVRALETGRLLHIHCLIQRQDAMKESSFDVELLDVPVKGSPNVED